VSSMVGEEYKEVNGEVADAVGEITNMICAGAKKNLAELGHKFDMATPIVIKGKDTEINEIGETTSTVIPFKTDKGEFVVEISLVPKG
ncbi:MAG: chemotaxis protein CheX, partial [Candidatus Dadabacteria bacterium]